MKKVSKSLSETEKIAKEFVDFIVQSEGDGLSATLVGLHGDLGAGKTTFMKGVVKAFGIMEEVTSPTYVIMKAYDLKHMKKSGRLVHIDAYRLEDPRELLNLGWKDIMENPENIIFMEWPEKVAGILPDDMKKIHFKHIDENTREIEIA